MGRAVDVQVTHEAEDAKVEFVTTCSAGPCDSSFGLTDFMVLTI